MQLQHNNITRLLENIMYRLKEAEVLREDQPGSPRYYNKTFELIHDELTCAVKLGKIKEGRS